MEIKKASRKKSKIKLGLSAPSGFGKTYSALLLGKGLVGSYEKIVVIDTENESASLYSHLGEYSVLPLQAPYTPERYMQAIDTCIKAGFDLIIIDSITHEWNGKGGCLEIVESLGGKYQDWAKVTPRHSAFIDKIIQSDVHIITTVRNKQDYEMNKDQNGKVKVEKVGMRQETRDGFEYELTISLDIINDKHLTKAGKDRTGLFMNKPEFVISEETGKQILDWCESGAEISLEQKVRGVYKSFTKIKSDVVSEKISSTISWIVKEDVDKMRALKALEAYWIELREPIVKSGLSAQYDKGINLIKEAQYKLLPDSERGKAIHAINSVDELLDKREKVEQIMKEHNEGLQ